MDIDWLRSTAIHKLWPEEDEEDELDIAADDEEVGGARTEFACFLLDGRNSGYFLKHLVAG